METFKLGDVVEFVAGGPRMTVEYHRELGIPGNHIVPPQPAGVGCVWFDATNQLRRALIAPSLLQVSKIPDCANPK